MHPVTGVYNMDVVIHKRVVTLLALVSLSLLVVSLWMYYSGKTGLRLQGVIHMVV